MAETVEVLGTLRPDGSLELAGKVALPPGPVRVRVEPLAAPAQGETLAEYVARARRELEAAGHRFRTREEIDAELAELRDEWDERLDELDRLRDKEGPKGS